MAGDILFLKVGKYSASRGLYLFHVATVIASPQGRGADNAKWCYWNKSINLILHDYKCYLEVLASWKGIIHSWSNGNVDKVDILAKIPSNKFINIIVS